MKSFSIFRTGRHTSSGGSSLEFSDAQLRAAVTAYDPALHEAPIVVGHPKDNHPAYGWVSGLNYNEETGEIEANPAQLDPAFSEMVEAGRFKKRSASWYLPDAPHNPKPGSLYLRHVGFLGAQPPAVKGLRDVSFAEEEGVVEYEDNRYAWGSVAAIMRGLRDWLIGEKDLETADKLIPNFYLNDLEAASRAATQDTTVAGAMPAYSEEDPMTIEALTAQVAALTAERDTLKANQRPADFAERETSLAAREAAVATAQIAAQRVTVEGRVDAAVKAGRLLPAQKKHAVDFAMGLVDGEATMSFGEGDKAKQVSQREAYLMQIEASPPAVNYGEIAGAGPAPTGDATDPQAIADKAREIADKAAKAGKTISYTEAVSRAAAEFTAA